MDDESEVKKCAYDECGLMFIALKHNMKYHSPECLRLATNKRLMQQYYAKSARRKGRIRECSTEGCMTKLSRYNDEDVCSKCRAAQAQRGREAIMRLLNEVD